MTYIADLSNCCYFASGSRLRAIGWLDDNRAYEVGPVSPEFIARLHEQLQDPFAIVDFGGGHACSLCESASAPYGNGELIVPAAKVCYVAPVLLAHYVEAHHYLPPTEFIEALLNCPPQKSALYMASVARFLSELNGVA